MFASFDPVALDVACADACNRMPVMPGSLLDENLRACGTGWTIMTILQMFRPIQIGARVWSMGEKKSVWARSYELITVK